MRKKFTAIASLAISFLIVFIITLVTVLNISHTTRWNAIAFENSTMSSYYLNSVSKEIYSIHKSFTSIMLTDSAEEKYTYIANINSSINTSHTLMDMLIHAQIQEGSDEIRQIILNMRDTFVQYSEAVMATATAITENEITDVRDLISEIERLYDNLLDQQNMAQNICLDHAEMELNLKEHSTTGLSVVLIILFALYFILTIITAISFLRFSKHNNSQAIPSVNAIDTNASTNMQYDVERLVKSIEALQKRVSELEYKKPL